MGRADLLFELGVCVLKFQNKLRRPTEHIETTIYDKCVILLVWWISSTVVSKHICIIIKLLNNYPSCFSRHLGCVLLSRSHVCVYIYIYTHVYKHIHAHIYIYIYICVPSWSGTYPIPHRRVCVPDHFHMFMLASLIHGY